jgi:hypothetical protein
MKRWYIILSVAAMAMMASNQARADFQVIRWTSGFCQIWDHAVPTMPIAGDFKAVSKRFKTFGEAWSERGKLIGRGTCW